MPDRTPDSSENPLQRRLALPYRHRAALFCRHRAALLALILICWTPVPGLSAAQDFSAALARADAAWDDRDEGHLEYLAAPEPVAEAIVRYEAAVLLQPGNFEARWKLMRALHFAGDFAEEGAQDDRETFDHCRRVSEAGVELLTARLGEDERPEEFDADELTEALAKAGLSIPDVSRFYLWSAIGWGTWGREAGIVGAVRKGVAGRMRRYVQVTQMLDPDVDEGGAYRVLSTLHRELPRLPFLTGWVDRDQAVPLIQQAVEIAPQNRGNQYLWAITMLDLEPQRRDEALALLEELASMEPRAGHVVETLKLRHQAQERLAVERGEVHGGAAAALNRIGG